jgi:spoIIIJ-associated protein
MPPTLIKDGKLDREATAGALRGFLEELLRTAGLELKVTVNAVPPDAGREAEVTADLDGRDKGILLERGGEVLSALEHLAMRALRLEQEWHEKIYIDCGGYRALRYEELQMTARVAAERVQATRQSFRLNPMNPRERRIVHVALKEMSGVRTESVGVGENRQVVIHPASASPGKPGR